MNMVCFLGAQDLLLGRVLRLFLCFEWLYGIEIGCKVGELDGKGGVECHTVQDAKYFML